MDQDHEIKTDLNCSNIAQKWTQEIQTCLFEALPQILPKIYGYSAVLRCILPLIVDEKEFG